MGLFSKKEASRDARWESLNEEYQNYRRRTAMELEQADSRAARQTAAKFLRLYDDLQRALESTCTDEAYYKGIELVQKNLIDIFAQLKIVPMDSKGKIFNPTYHEAVGQIKDDALRAEEIAEVVQVGFLMDDEVLRHAKVIVANCE